MNKLILTLIAVLFCATSHAKLICMNDEITYIEDIKSFGIPNVPVGTPMGSKILIVRGQTVAQKDFTVEDGKDWTNYKDWNYKLHMQDEKTVWVNPDNIYDQALTAKLTVIDEAGTEIVSEAAVNCLVNELVMP